MDNKEMINKAIDLLEPFATRYYPTTSEVNWVVDNKGNSDWDDQCADCIDEYVIKIREKYLTSQNKLPVNKRDKEPKTFDSAANYGGGYEDETFRCCQTCGKELNISILPQVNEIELLIEDLEGGVIDDRTGYRAYCMLYNDWGDNDKHERTKAPMLQLAKRVIELLG